MPASFLSHHNPYYYHRSCLKFLHKLFPVAVVVVVAGERVDAGHSTWWRKVPWAPYTMYTTGTLSSFVYHILYFFTLLLSFTVFGRLQVIVFISSHALTSLWFLTRLFIPRSSDLLCFNPISLDFRWRENLVFISSHTLNYNLKSIAVPIILCFVPICYSSLNDKEALVFTSS